MRGQRDLLFSLMTVSELQAARQRLTREMQEAYEYEGRDADVSALSEHRDAVDDELALRAEAPLGGPTIVQL